MQFCFLFLSSSLLVALSTASESVIPEQPVLTTQSACLNGCFQEGSRIFAASNLHNFETIVKNVDEFCGIYSDLMKCGQGCSDDDQTELQKRVSVTVSSYICAQKLDDFKAVKDCLRSQETSGLQSCEEQCNLNDNILQLDSSSTSAVNPFVFYDSIGPVCDKVKCTVKCAIGELNKRCAAAGDLFKDLGYKQVLEASARVHRDAANDSAPIASQLAKIYLEALPDKCKFVIDPEIYDETFTEKEETGSDVVTKIVPAVLLSDDDGTIEAVTPLAKKEPVTTDEATDESAEEAETSTEKPKTEVEGDTARGTTATLEFEPVNEPEVPIGPPSKGSATEKPEGTINPADLPVEEGVEIQEQPVPSPASIEPVPEQDQPEQTTTPMAKEEEQPEIAEGEITEPEHTIHVVNSEEVGNNIVHDAASPQNSGASLIASLFFFITAFFLTF